MNGSADWGKRAACRDFPTAMFFEDVEPEDDEGNPLPLDLEGLDRARSVCGRCPVRLQCYQAAMEEEGGAARLQRHGVRGGITAAQRYSVWRRDSMSCDRCGEVYDPLGLVEGETVCECGATDETPIDPEGDRWYPRHDALLQKLIAWLIENTQPGDRIPPPYQMLLLLGHRRKDDLPLAYEKLIDDGLIERGEGRGEYYRKEGARAFKSWVPPIHRHRARRAA